MHRQFRPFGLVFEINEGLLPFFQKDPFRPLQQIGIRVIGTAQAQVPPWRRTDDLLYRTLVSILDAPAASLFTKEVQSATLEPSRAAEIECTGGGARNQGKKIFQHRPVGMKTLWKLKKDRSQFPVQNR